MTTNLINCIYFLLDKDADNGLLKLVVTCLQQIQFNAD